MLFSKKVKERFQLATLSPDKSLSYKAHEEALKKYCETRGLKGTNVPIAGKPYLQQVTCEIQNFAKCKEFDQLAKDNDLPFGYKWVKVPTRILNDQLRQQLGEVKHFQLKEILEKYKDIKIDKDTAHLNITNECFLEKKYYVDDAEGARYTVSRTVGTDSCNKDPKFSAKHLAADETYFLKLKDLDNQVVAIVNPLDSTFSLDDIDRKRWMNLDWKISADTIKDKVKAKELKNRDIKTLAPIIDLQNFGPMYIDNGEQEMCIKHLRWMENFCNEMQPCDGLNKGSDTKTCPKTNNYFMFTLGNPVCYVDQGYCEPDTQTDSQTANCVMKKDYCEAMGLDYYPAETVTTVCANPNEPTLCTTRMSRGGCGFSDVQAFVENMPIGTTLTRKFKQAGEEVAAKCAGSGINSNECASAVFGLIATPGVVIGDTSMAYFGQTFDKFRDAWSNAFNNPSPEALIAVFDTVSMIPGVYVNAKLGEMLDQIILQIPKVGEIFGGKGFIEFYMSYAALAGINPAIAAFWAGKKVIPLLISYYYFYGPEYADKARYYIVNNPATNWVVNAWDDVKDAFSTAYNWLDEYIF